MIATPLLLALALAPSALAQAPSSSALEAEPTELEHERARLAAEQQALRREMQALRREVAELRDEPIDGDGDGEQIGFGRHVSVRAGQQRDEVVSFGGDVVIEGSVVGDAVSFGGDVVIEHSGRVGGDAVSFGGEVMVLDGGTVEGDRVTMGLPGVALELAPAAGDHHAVGSMPLVSDTSLLLQQLYHRLVLLLSVAGAGVLVVGLFPGRVSRVARDLEQRPVRAALVGLLASGSITLFSVLFGLSTLGLGLPVSAILMGGLGLAWLLGFVGLCEVVGDRLPLERRPHGRWLAFLVGIVLLTLVSSLPWIGWLVIGAASIIGVGGALSTRFGAAT
ncbi:MAG TPA: hypothetical protein ENK18_08855 [Deltaproteobacteria bacterium]|nr:hypothetical protein [Deltaproteobacteria bacterium]